MSRERDLKPKFFGLRFFFASAAACYNENEFCCECREQNSKKALTLSFFCWRFNVLAVHISRDNFNIYYIIYRIAKQTLFAHVVNMLLLSTQNRFCV